MHIDGSCHCGNITFEFVWEPDPEEIPARACDCTFCRKNGGSWTSTPTGSLKVSVQQPSLVNIYSFGTGTAQFHICNRCGIVPLATSSIDDHLYAVVNVNTFNNVAQSLLHPSPVSFEGEKPTERLERRRRNWIPLVEFN